MSPIWSWLAGFGLGVMHGRAALGDLGTKGYIAPYASIRHPEVVLRTGSYIGDWVSVLHDPGGGSIVLGPGAKIYGRSLLRTGAGGAISIAKGTHVQPDTYFVACLSSICIGEYVEIAAGCSFYSFNHGIEAGALIMSQPLSSRGPIVIGNGAWLGHGVTVLDGVSVGAGAVIGAGSVVTRDIPANSIAVGSPARVVGVRKASSI